MTDVVHLRKHEAVRDCGSYEVWFEDGLPSKFFYFDDLPDGLLRPDIMTKAQAAEAAHALGHLLPHCLGLDAPKCLGRAEVPPRQGSIAVNTFRLVKIV